MEEEKKKYTASARVEQARQEAQASDGKGPGNTPPNGSGNWTRPWRKS